MRSDGAQFAGRLVRFSPRQRHGGTNLQIADRLEIVVKGKRQAALETTPEVAGLSPSENGFLMEEHRCRCLEMPDHWIPYYLVALHFAEKPVRRFLFESGREQECVVHNETCDVVAPHELRRFRSEGESRSMIVSIEPEVLESIIADSPRRNPLELLMHWHGEDAALSGLILKLSSEVKFGFPDGTLSADALCMRLSEHLVERYSIRGARLDRYKGGLSGARLRLVMDYIDSHLEVNLKAGEIARVAGLSKYHCGKAFKQSTGMPLHSYVLTRRMDRSRQLLVGSNLSLAEISEASGFASQSHFTTVFSTRIGITPEFYRQMHRRLSLNVGLPKAQNSMWAGTDGHEAMAIEQFG